MNAAILILAFASLIGFAWIGRASEVRIGAIARGSCAALVLAIAAAALYSAGEAASDRVADFLAISLPAMVMARATLRVMWSAREGDSVRGAAFASLCTGVILMLLAVAGRLSLVDAQILLAAGAVLLLVSDRGRHDAQVSVRPLVLVLIAVVAGALWGAVMVRGYTPFAIIVPAFLFLGGMVAAMKDPSDAFRQSAAAGTTSVVVALGGGAVGSVVRTAAGNYGLYHPAGIGEHFEILAQSVAAARPMIGLGRLAPEALLLVACSAVVLTVPSGTKMSRLIAIVLGLGGLLLATDRMLGAVGVMPFVF